MSIPLGAFRFNTDSSKLEYYDGNQWVNVTSTSPEAETGGTRGVWMGGASPSDTDRIDYANLTTTGNALDFGNLTVARHSNGDGGMASRTRGFYARGTSPIEGRIEYVNFASGGQVTASTTGDAIVFGTMQNNITNGTSSASDATRGLMFGGYAAPATLGDIQYITMASTGNGKDFGDLINGGSSSAFSSTTRAIEVRNAGNQAEYVTISSLGDSLDFGDSTFTGGHRAWASNTIRGVSLGGELSPSGAKTDIIEYMTIATLGNAVDFGDCIAAIAEGSSASSRTRAVLGGGNPSSQNLMQYVQLMSTGNSVDFGDLTIGRGHCDACSNGHGGLG